jgi:hypothetical protein
MSRAVFVFLLLVCLERTGIREMPCRCELGDSEGVVVGDVKTDTEVEGTSKHCLWKSFISIFLIQCGFLAEKMRSPK